MPVKIMALLKAKADMARAQLIERCEDEYVPFISRMLPLVQNHRRHYVTDERSPALVAAGSPFVETGLDMISEWIFADSGGEAEIGKALTNADTRTAIGKFEAEIFDAAHVKKFAVETAHAPPVPLAPHPTGFDGPPAIRTFVLLQKNPAMSRRQFVDHYENNHVPLVLRHLECNGKPLFATYIRNYPLPPEASNVIDKFVGGMAPYDVLSEICYWSEADAEEFGPCMAREEAVAAFAKENEIMLRLDGFRMVQIKTYGDR